MLTRLEKVTKPSRKSLESTNPHIEDMQDQLYPPHERKSIKITVRSRHGTVCKVSKDPRGTSQQLQASLILANVHVHESISTVEHQTPPAVCMAGFQGERHCCLKRVQTPPVHRHTHTEENQPYCYPLQDWSPTKPTPWARCVIVQKVSKEPRGTSEQPKVFLHTGSC